LQEEAEELTASRLGVPIIEGRAAAICSTIRRTAWR
jgi:hypothetical protein